MSESPKDSFNEDAIKNNSENAEDHDPHYDPIISLPEVEVPTLEEDETVMLNLRAKLYRYDSNEDPPEWKERGTGNVKILRHKLHNTVRVVMRRDKTLKLCANHFILPHMKLKPNASCERAWVYSVKDFSDGTVKSELLAIKFANLENAQKWKDTFEEAKNIVANVENSKSDSQVEEKAVSEESPKLNDTFEEDKKISVSGNIEKKKVEDVKKECSSQISDKLSSMKINAANECS